MAARGLEQDLGPESVGARERRRVDDGPIVVALGGEVDDEVGLELAVDLDHAGEVADVVDDEVNAVADSVEVRFIGGERHVVERHDGGSGLACQDVVDEIRADEAAGAGDEIGGHGQIPEAGR